MAQTLKSRLWRIFFTAYTPNPDAQSFLSRAQTQEAEGVQVTVAVLDRAESEKFFGVPLARRGIQPVHVKIANNSATALRLQFVMLSPNYYTPLEAAAANHFSIIKRLSTFGLIGVVFFWLLVLIPFKLITAYFANGRMDEYFKEHSFRLRPVQPGETAEGFVFTPLDAGVKIVHVCLHDTSTTIASAIANAEAGKPNEPSVEFTFSVNVPGIAVDYSHCELTDAQPGVTLEPCSGEQLIARLKTMPPATTNAKSSRSGDPVNLVVLGDFETLIGAFAARWDECETISLATCWQTAKAFLIGSDYRYSPVSPLFLFGRQQDIALQRTRHSINERLHLRLWRTPLRFQEEPVWVGQVSRDIGVRFTTKVWNLTTHRIDPEVDEARDYVLEDLMHCERVEAAGYIEGVGACAPGTFRHNLTGDPYFTDGNRVVILLSKTPTAPRFVAWS